MFFDLSETKREKQRETESQFSSLFHLSKNRHTQYHFKNMTDDYNLTPDSTIAITNDDATSCKLYSIFFFGSDLRKTFFIIFHVPSPKIQY